MKNIFKKSISVILATLLCISTLVGLSSTTFAIDAADIWDGKTQTQPDVGDGSEGSPYEISKPEHLAWMVTNGTTNKGKYYKLTKDIYLNDVSDSNWYEKSDANHWFDGATVLLKKFIFEGHVDGDGHIVYGILSENNTTAAVMGLIPQMDKGSVKNIGVRESRISSNARKVGAAGIVGYSANAFEITIDRCFVDETVSISADCGDSNSGIAGILGWSNGKNNGTKDAFVKITNCYSKATVTATNNKQNANGIIGLNHRTGSKVNDCYSVGLPPYYMGNSNSMSYCVINGLDKNNVLSNVYSDCEAYTATGDIYTDNHTVVAGELMLGENARTYMSGLDFTKTYEIVNNSTPKLKIFPTAVDDENEKQRGENEWDGSLDAELAGDGTQESPYLVTNAGELAFVVKNGGVDGAYYKLTNDIVLNDMSKVNKETGAVDSDYLAIPWYSSEGVKAFISAEFDGAGHTVSGIYSNFEGEFANGDSNGATALFPLTRQTAGETVIKNLGIADSYLRDYSAAAAIVGYVGNNAAINLTIDSCFAEEDVVIKGNVAGGIYGSGSINATVTNCYSWASLTAGNAARTGIVADWWGDGSTKVLNITSCFSNGKNYGNKATNVENCIENFALKGDTALDGIDGLSDAVWYAVKDDNKYPMLRARGKAIRDIDENGIFEADKDFVALKKLLLSDEPGYNNGDVNNDDSFDIRDLLSLKKYIIKIA